MLSLCYFESLSLVEASALDLSKYTVPPHTISSPHTFFLFLCVVTGMSHHTSPSITVVQLRHRVIDGADQMCPEPVQALVRLRVPVVDVPTLVTQICRTLCPVVVQQGLGRHYTRLVRHVRVQRTQGVVVEDCQRSSGADERLAAEAAAADVGAALCVAQDVKVLWKTRVRSQSEVVEKVRVSY